MAVLPMNGGKEGSGGYFIKLTSMSSAQGLSNYDVTQNQIVAEHYTELTSDNFIVVPRSGGQSKNTWYVSAYVRFQESLTLQPAITYDATTGKLNVGGTSSAVRLWDANGGTNYMSQTGVITSDIYVIIGCQIIQ